jgi:hypothetical protein
MGMIAEKRGNKPEAIRLYAQAVVANREVPEARESLLKLTSADSVEKLLASARLELPSYNKLDLGQLMPNLKEPTEAEFYLVLVPDAARNAQVVDVKFIKGKDSLKPLSSQLKAVKYPLLFPDSSPTKIVRRAALLCLPKPGACTLTLISPDLITSVE